MESKYKAVINNREIETHDIREWESKEVLVKILKVPINPIDTFKIDAPAEALSSLPPSTGIGFDAIGIIVDIGHDVDESFKNKKVAVYQTIFGPGFSGTWRQYLYCTPEDIYELPDELDSDSEWYFVGNPLATVGLATQCEKYNAKAVIQDGACSSVGKMLVKLMKKKGIPLINIVRSESQEKYLKDYGAENIFNSTNETFLSDLAETVTALEANVFIEWIGDKNVKPIMHMMSLGSTVVFYGTLQPENLEISSPDILFGHKTLTYFAAPSWISTLSVEEKLKITEDIMKDFTEGGEIYGCKWFKKYPLKDLDLALEEYPKYRSQGKLVICMQDRE